MSFQVTTASRYGDAAWDFSKEHFAARAPHCRVIHWNGVYARQPAILETVKAFAWARIRGMPTLRSVGWSTVRTYVTQLRTIARILEGMGLRGFGDVTLENSGAILCALPQNHTGKEMLSVLKQLFGMGHLPHVPASNPFDNCVAKAMFRSCTSEPTEEIPDHIIRAMVLRALGYRSRVGELMALRLSRDMECEFAKARGIRNGHDIVRETRHTVAAGIVLILAATGVRCGELLSLRRGSLRRDTSDSSRWCLHATVYKFHGTGAEVHWLCTRLGAAGYELLARIAPAESTDLVVGVRSQKVLTEASVNCYLRDWMAAQEWRNADGMPHIVRSHQFRPTFAQAVMEHPKMNEFALRDHFKHLHVGMTDGYVGSKTALAHRMTRNYPKAAKVEFEREAMRDMKLVDTL